MQQLNERTRAWRERIGITALAGIVLSALLVGLAGAATTISPTQPGSPPFTRDTSVNITVNPVAAQFARTGNATSTFTRSTVLGAFCAGDNPATGGVNNSPRTIVEVVGPGSVGTVFSQTSPVLKNASLGDALGGYQPANPQPAPNATNWRGGAYGSTVSGAGASTNATRPWTVTVNLDGKPGGIYTVRTTTINKIRTGPTSGPGACLDGQADRNGANTGWAATFTTSPGGKVETQTFEYRPWQEVFTDVLGNGTVKANVVPKEFQSAIRATTGRIFQGNNANQKFFALPDAASFALPSDPSTCAANPNSCLPAAASPCDPSAGCVPRLMILNNKAGKAAGNPGEEILGIFDLDTQAFIAQVRIAQKQQLMLSLGTEGDAAYHDLLQQLADAAAEQGIDLMTLLATKVRLRTGEREITLSLLNGLQWDASSEPAGVQIVTGPSVQAGLILDIYANLGSAACTTNTLDSDPSTVAPDRGQPTSDVGYTVEKSDLLPDVPRVGPVGALVGGPIYHIEGDFVGTGSALVNTATAVIGVDTAADEPNGYPIWVEPFLSTPPHVAVPKTMDFIGTATFSASETNLGALGCLVVDFMLGAGVAIFDNPLPIGFGDIPIWDPQSAEVQALMAQVNAAVQEVVDTVASDPTVNGLLEDILAELPI